MSKRKYTIHHVYGEHLTDFMRAILEIAWNVYINNNIKISLRLFAQIVGLPEATGHHE